MWSIAGYALMALLSLNAAINFSFHLRDAWRERFPSTYNVYYIFAKGQGSATLIVPMLEGHIAEVEAYLEKTSPQFENPRIVSWVKVK